jgi:cytochrome c551/c552
MKRWFKRILVGSLVILIGLQFIPVDRTNPPERGQPVAPLQVQVVLRRACYDCHSNETVWPWYSKIAPVSLLLARDVKKGRKELNFSTWENYAGRRRQRKLREMVKEVDRGKMPPAYYAPLHPAAKLSAADRGLIINWAQQN